MLPLSSSPMARSSESDRARPYFGDTEIILAKYFG
jgi:hypothetical protein